MANKTHALGNLISNDWLVNEMLKTILERYNNKVLETEETMDVETMPIEELASILTTYEMNLVEQKKDLLWRAKTKALIFMLGIQAMI